MNPATDRRKRRDRRGGRSPTLWSSGVVVLAVVGALAAVIVLAVSVVRSDRERLLQDFGVERLHLMEEIALEIEADFARVGGDLELAGRLVRSADSAAARERELAAMVAVIPFYRAIDVRDPRGSLLLRVTAPDEDPTKIDGFDHSLEAAALRAQHRGPAQATTSPRLLEDETGWLRVFALAFEDGQDDEPSIVAFLVDTRTFFEKVNLVSAERTAHVVVLGSHGMPTPITTPALADFIRDMAGQREELPELAALVDEMRTSKRGARLVSEGEARAIGLDETELLATFAPVVVTGGNWNVALLTSTLSLRANEQLLLERVLTVVALAVFFLGGIGTYVVVIARRSAALNARLMHADRLAHLHEKADKILESIPTAVAGLDEDGRVSSLNRALRDRLGGQGVGGSLEEAFSAASTRSLERLRDLAADALESGKPRSVYGETMGLFGSEGQYSVHAVPLERRFADTRLLLVIEDLSEVRALETQLLRSEKLATVGVLAAGIAHEIGTPLGIVRGRAEYIMGKLPAGDPNLAGLQVILDQSDQVSRTIRQLLDFSRTRPAGKRPVRLRSLAENIGELLSIEADRQNVSLEVDVPEDLPPLAADPAQLEQVLVNLLMNATDACERDGRVVLRARPCEAGGGDVHIEVADDGCGIPPGNRNRVFDPFFTTKKRGKGTGLGLSIAAEIIRNHGGEIEIESEVGEGTRVLVLWPAAAQAEERARAG